MSDLQATFQGELQLAGWSETHNGGCKVTFWLPDAAELDAFRALTVRKGNTAGHRFMAALVEIGDDEQPVQQAEPEKAKGGPLAKLAGMLCAEPEFWDFLTHQCSLDEAIEGPLMAAEQVRLLCGIESRAELDSNLEAGAAFHRTIRSPWIKWRERKGLK
jgi:hypothetical protein